MLKGQLTKYSYFNTWLPPLSKALTFLKFYLARKKNNKDPAILGGEGKLTPPPSPPPQKRKANVSHDFTMRFQR